MVSPIRHCNNTAGRPCELCKFNNLDTNPKFYEICSNKKHEVEFDANCKTEKCIYLISCKKCILQYVGKTDNTVRDRYNGHRGHINGGTESALMLNHFTNVHTLLDMIIKPIEICTYQKVLLEREKYWMLQLNTVFPYGLNDRTNVTGFKDAFKIVMEQENSKAVYSVFNKNPSRRTARGKKTNNDNPRFSPIRCTNEFSPSEFIDILITEIAQLDNQEIIHRCRTEIFALNHIHCNRLFLHLTKSIYDGVKLVFDKHDFLIHVLRDLCFNKVQITTEKKKSEHFLPVYYVNRLMDSIDVNRIIKKQNIVDLFPIKSDVGTPTISFSYGNTIRSKVVNYKETIRNPVRTCHCHAFDDKFKVLEHGHVFTGDLDIIGNQELKKVLGYGLNYREQQAPNKNKALKEYKAGIDKYINKICDKFKISIQQFLPWKIELCKAIEAALDKCEPFGYNNVLCKQKNKEDLDTIKTQFVLVPIDKAGNNVALICKKYYIETLEKELNSRTFVKVNTTSNDFIKKCNDNLKNFGFEFDKDKQSIPYLYWSAKMHKTPPKHRFITSGTNTIISGLSEKVTQCMKVLVNTARYLDNYKIRGINRHMSIIDNRADVLSFINQSNKLNDRNKSIKSFDFENLYTNIPHNKLKDKIKWFVFRIFELKNSNFITIGSNRAYFTKERSKKLKSCNKQELMGWIEYIIDNSMVEYLGELYKQVIGIPMGTSCAPYLANIFLHIYEYKYLKDLVENGQLNVARKLQNLFRYQDDCLALNDSAEFSNHFIHIYPPELTLKNTNISAAKCTFLDLSISVFRGKFLYKSYDKRNDFNFEVVKFPHLHGKIPRKPSYGVFTSQVIRFCDVNCTIKNFGNDVQNTVKRFTKQGFSKLNLLGHYKKFCQMYYYKWSKFGTNIVNLIKF